MKKIIVLVIVMAVTLCVQPAMGSLVSHWTLEQTLADSVGNNDGQTTGPEVDPAYVYDSFRDSYVVEFTPTGYSDASQRIIVSHTSELATESFTINVWLKAAFKGTYGGIISTADKNPTSVDEAGYIMYAQPVTVDGVKDDYFSFWTGNNNWQKVISSTPVDGGEEEGVWTMVTATYDAMTAEQCLYADGVLIGSMNTTTPYVPAGDSDFFIGAAMNYGTPNFSFAGAIDDVRYYNDAMSSTQITGLYEATVTPEPATLALLGLGALVLRRRKS